MKKLWEHMNAFHKIILAKLWTVVSNIARHRLGLSEWAITIILMLSTSGLGDMDLCRENLDQDILTKDLIPFSQIYERSFDDGDKHEMAKTWNGHEFSYSSLVDRFILRLNSDTLNNLGPSDIATRFLLAKKFLITKAEGKSLYNFQMDGFERINSLLRGNLLDKIQDQKQILKDIRQIRKVFSRLPGLPTEMNLYRGVPLSAVGQVPAVGEVINDPAFKSTSGSADSAEVFVYGVPGKEYDGIVSTNHRKVFLTDLHNGANADRLPKEGIVYVYHLAKGSKVLPFYYFLYYLNSGVVTEENEGVIKTEEELLLSDSLKGKVVRIDPPKEIWTNAIGKSGEIVKAKALVHYVHVSVEP